MTAVALDVRPRPLPVALVLARQEGWRIVKHPLSLVGAALTVVGVLVVGDNGSRDAFEAPITGVTFYYGVLVYFAAHLVASRDRRSGSRELLAATSAPRADRVAGLCLGALLPAALAAAFVAAVHQANLARALYSGAVDATPTAWHLAQAPLTVLGAALLGVMVARLTKVPGTPLLVMVTMVAAVAWLTNRPESLQPLATYVTWAQYGGGSGWAGHYPGSVPWHVVYLVGLCAMAACGAFLRDARRPWRVLLLGAALTAATAVPAYLQLP